MSAPEPARRRGPTWLAPALLVAGALAIPYAPLLAGRIVFNRDVGRWTYPARWFVRDALARGQSPLWNPDVGLGISVPSNPLYGLFYPPNLLHLLLPVAHAVTWWTFLHVLFGGLGVVLLARRLGAAGSAALTGAVAFGISGFLSAEWTTGLLLPAGTWLPWAGLGFVGLARGCRARGTWLRGVVSAALPVAFAFLLGEVFLAIIAAGFGLALGALWLTTAPPESGEAAATARSLTPRFAGGAALAAVLAVAVAAVALLPASLGAAGTPRAVPLPRAVAESLSVHPQHLLDLVVAGGHGKAWEGNANTEWAERVLGGQPFTLRYYLGGSVLALALLAFRRPGNSGAAPAAGQRRRAFLTIGIGAVAVLGVAIALGSHLPVHALLRTLVPPLAFMRTPEKYLVITVCAVALLAALGASRLGAREAPARPVRLVALLLLMGALVGGAGALFPPDLAPVMRAGAGHGALGVVAVLGATLLGRTRPAAASLLVLAAVSVDLGVAAQDGLRFGPSQRLTAEPPAAAAIAASAGPTGPRSRLFRSPVLQQTLARFGGDDTDARSRLTLRDNLSVPFGIAILPGYDPATPPALATLLESSRRDALRLLAVDYALLSLRPEQAGAPPPPGLDPVMDPLPGTRLYRVKEALPRVYRASRSERRNQTEALRRVLEADVLRGETVILDAAATGAPILEGPPGADDQCRLIRFANDHLEAVCHGERPGFAVFVEQHAPGWQATVDGSAAPIFLANTVARAVPVPAGEHRVALRFAAPGLKAGAAVSSMSALVLLGGYALGRRRRRSARPPTPRSLAPGV